VTFVSLERAQHVQRADSIGCICGDANSGWRGMSGRDEIMGKVLQTAPVFLTESSSQPLQLPPGLCPPLLRLSLGIKQTNCAKCGTLHSLALLLSSSLVPLSLCDFTYAPAYKPRSAGTLSCLPSVHRLSV
jgi:hypothetical protein